MAGPIQMAVTVAPVRSGEQGDATARLERCFRDHYADVLAFTLRRVGERARAEDLAAETFVAAWRRRESVPADPLPWLFGVARGLIANELRSARRRERLTSELAHSRAVDHRGDPAKVVEARIVALEALGRLNERDQEILRLVAWEGLDARRASTVIGCSAATFAVRLHRARRRLAAELAAAGARDAGRDEPIETHPDEEEER